MGDNPISQYLRGLGYNVMKHGEKRVVNKKIRDGMETNRKIFLKVYFNTD